MFSCVDCHTDVKSLAHESTPQKITCAQCHADAQEAYSHSLHAKRTKGSAAAHPSIGKMQAATAQARRKAAQLNIEADFDGELQVDAALIPEIASRKLQDSPVAGRANVLIFPDLNSGNIASKLLSVVSRTSSYGQILLGLNRPAADVSRGSSAHDILGVAAIIGVQATDYLKLYPEADKELPGD